MYKAGDAVEYGPKKHKAKIIKILSSGRYLIEFDDINLIPPQMDVPGDHLSKFYSYVDLDGIDSGYYDDLYKDPDNCPRCGNKWKETWIGSRPFYDCLKCNIKREDV